MSLEELRNLLNGIEIFTDKVAYRCFPEDIKTGFPFVCFYVTQTDNFKADGQVYKTRTEVTVELYTETKDLYSEKALEDAFEQDSIPWDKFEEYLTDEECYQISYEIII